MKKIVLSTLALSTALTSATAFAQVAPEATQAANADTTGVKPDEPANDDIVVTARREAENLQNVPVSVQVVSGATVQKLAITQVSEISKLSPGLTLSGTTTDTKIVLRGVTWQPGSGTPATPLYFNEVPFDPQNTLLSLFDVGQIEVLRGPQGTTRGAPSISGAVTITTRRPDMDEFGGYVQGQYSSGNRTNFQGAINVPVVKDVFALRAAVNIEDSRSDRVYSVNSRIKPDFRSRVYRLSALFTPTDTISIGAMFQRTDNRTLSYLQVEGTGSRGQAAAGIPANFNGPAITREDRRSVQDAPFINPYKTDLITGNVSWDVLGHTLTYNYGRSFDRTGTISLATDNANMLPGFEAYNLQSYVGKPLFQTHEVRISSLPSDSRPFDYDLGWFSKKSDGTINFAVPVYLAGAFGPLGALPGAVRTPDSRYVLQSSTNIRIGQKFDAFYGNVRFHLGEKTELSGGLSILRDRVPLDLQITTGAARTIAATLASLGGLPCPGIPGVFVTGLVNSNYAGFCDFVIPAGTQPRQTFNNKYSDAIYNFSLSHKFTDDFLAYATTGTSFRTGLPAINNTGLPNALLVPEPEKATSYEVGVKTSLGRRLRVNASAFQINYQNQLTSFAGVPYFNSISGQTAVTSIAFYRNVDSRVRGGELEITARPLKDLSLGLNFSYSKIQSRGGQVPCANATGPALSAANPINFCTSPKGQTLNTEAPFQLTTNGSYDLPLGSSLAGYFRYNVNYHGKNPNFGNFRDAAGNFRRGSKYAIVDLFAGVSGNDSAWDIGIYAKNVFDTQSELTRTVLLNNIYAPFAGADDGYDQIRTLAPRQIGVTARFAFGSR